MKDYIGTKALKAEPMTRGDYNAHRGWTPPAGEDQSVAGYHVVYADGYESWTPAPQFEAAYQAFGAMNFGHALEMLKLGHKVARGGWNGKGMFIYMVPANSYPAQTGAAKRHFGADALVPYTSYLAIKSVNETVSPWLASQTDVLSDDWALVA